MSVWSDTFSAVAVAVSAGSFYLAKKANDRAAIREQPAIYFQRSGANVLMINVGREPIVALEWTEAGALRARAVLEFNEWQAVADSFNQIYGDDAYVTFDFPTGQTWRATLFGDKTNEPERLKWEVERYKPPKR